MLTRLWQYRWLFWIMNRKGYTVYGYEMRERKIFLKYKVSEFGNFLNGVRHEVREYIQTEKANGVTTFAVFGVSMGNIYALNCAKYLKDIDKAIINLTYGSMAHNFWTYKRHRPTVSHFLEGISSEEEVKEKLGTAETTDNLQALRSKKILVFSSRNDTVLPDTLKFKKKLIESGVKAVYYESSLGHTAAAFMNLVNKDRWLSFLERTN